MYTKNHALLLVNHDRELAQIYLDMCKREGTDYDRILHKLYLEVILPEPRFRLKYDAILGREVVERRLNHNDNSKKLKAFVKELGWQSFIQTFEHFARIQAQDCNRIGIPDAAKVWARIADIIANLPKRPQM